MTECDTLLNAANGPIELWRLADVLCVCKDECLINIEADGKDILGIGNRKTIDFVNRKVFPEELFVVGKLNYQWYVKCVLQLVKKDIHNTRRFNNDKMIFLY